LANKLSKDTGAETALAWDTLDLLEMVLFGVVTSPPSSPPGPAAPPSKRFPPPSHPQQNQKPNQNDIIDKSIAHHTRGMEYFEAENYDRAIQEYNKAIQLDPRNADYFDSRALAYLYKDNKDAAIRDIKKAMRLEPKNKNYPEHLRMVQEADDEDDDSGDEEEDDDYEDDEDDDEYDGRDGKRSGFTIKCRKCGSEYSVTDKRTLRCFDQGFSCDRCRASWRVSFFGTCARCKEDAGFDDWSWGSGLAYLGTSFLTALNRKDSIFTTLGDITNSMTPESGAFGVCPICKQEHVTCPKCGRASPFSTLKEAGGKTIRCRHCGQKMKL
jgi:hypothetical protein